MIQDFNESMLHRFLSETDTIPYLDCCCQDCPVPTSFGETISQTQRLIASEFFLFSRVMWSSLKLKFSLLVDKPSL